VSYFVEQLNTSYLGFYIITYMHTHDTQRAFKWINTKSTNDNIVWVFRASYKTTKDLIFMRLLLWLLW